MGAWNSSKNREILTGAGPLNVRVPVSIIDCTAGGFVCWLPAPGASPEGFVKTVIFQNHDGVSPMPALAFRALGTTDDKIDIGDNVEARSLLVDPDTSGSPVDVVLNFQVINGAWRLLWSAGVVTTNDVVEPVPFAPTLAPLGQQQFTLGANTNEVIPMLPGAVAAIGGVTWSVEDVGGGTITANGLYTAPAGAGTYTVRATFANGKYYETDVTVA